MLMKNILVVDDDESIREMITYILESEGFEVSGLENGQAVVGTVQDTHPDLVLLDVQLGDSDGRDICRELKQLPATREVPVMMLSANADWQALNEKNCEPDDFL